jgi:hypothetical protein
MLLVSDGGNQPRVRRETRAPYVGGDGTSHPIGKNRGQKVSKVLGRPPGEPIGQGGQYRAGASAAFIRRSKTSAFTNEFGELVVGQAIQPSFNATLID